MIRYVVISSDPGADAAALNRINLMSEGIRANGGECVIYVIPLKKTNLFYRLCSGIYYALFMIFIFLISSKNDSIILYGTFPLLSYLFMFSSKRYKLYAEKTEYPAHVLYDELCCDKRVFDRSKKYCESLKLVDGFITCSSYLKDYYQQYTKSTCDFLILPVVVDVNSYSSLKRNVNSKFITYCGDFSGSKDGLVILLEAFSKVIRIHPQYKLKLIGGTNSQKDFDRINEMVHTLQLIDSVVFTGRVPHSSIPSLLCDSSILVLSRPMNKQAEGGFPSKLAEYLSTGIPTLVTNVGEISVYFEDNIDIFLSEPDSSSKFANKIISIIDNYEYAISVGKKGQEKVKMFDYKSQSCLLFEFLKR